MKKTMMVAALGVCTICSAALAAETTKTTATAVPDRIVTAIVVQRAQPGDHLGSRIVGAKVHSASGDEIGSVDDLIVDRGGRITGVVVGVGGFLGVGEKNVALAWDALTLTTGSDGKPHVAVHITKDELLKASPFVASSPS